jgi:hypothetical protein
MRTLTLIALALVAFGCNDKPVVDGQPQKEATPAATPAPPKIDTRDQYTFVKDVMKAQRADLEEDPNAYYRVEQSWSGKRFRWELAYVPLLCRSADSCLMAPFDHARFEKRVIQGWLPRVELDAVAHAALVAQCRDKKRCIVTVDGKMKASLSSEQPTSVAFEQARIDRVRDAGRDESWIVARR